MTFAMMVLGCKVNDFEATYVREQLLEKGYEEVSFKEKADIYIVFTCAVTNMAEAKTRKYIRRTKKQNPDAFTVAVGCLVQIDENGEVFDDIDLLIGSEEKEKIVPFIEERMKGRYLSKSPSPKFEEMPLSSYPGKSRAFLKIEDGCDQFCAYCVSPYARGRERSARHEYVLEEAKKLAEYSPEIVLTGIHTGRYFDGEWHLEDLLRELVKIEKLKTIRLSSIEMNEITDGILDLFKTGKMGRNLHIPVQSLSDEVLKAMRRPYTLKEYKERIAEIRERIPGISISTDLIVGFPGETEEIFEGILKEIDEIGFSFIHVFPYARKKGTLADRLPGHIDNGAKKRRVNEVMRRVAPHTQAFERSYIGKQTDVLIEYTENGYSYGYAKEYFYVKIKGELPAGEIARVHIEDVNEEGVIGKVCC